MALTETSISAACAATDTSLTVAAAGTIAIGMAITVDDEQMTVTKAYVAASTTVPVLRGQNGCLPVAHGINAAVEYGLASDAEWGASAAQTSAQFLIGGRARQMRSYGASGAITLPDPGADGFAILNAVSTTVLAMTLALPGKAHDGCVLTIASRNGTGAHTITLAAGLNGAGANYDVFTFPAGPVMIQLVALDQFWYAVACPAWTGTVTLLTGGIA